MSKAWTLEGSRLTTARRMRGLKRSELANKLNVPEEDIAAWEKRREWCTDKGIIFKLSMLLQFPPKFFIGPEIENLEFEDTSLALRNTHERNTDT